MSVLFPFALHNVNGFIISFDEIVNIAVGEGRISVSFTLEPNWENLVFQKKKYSSDISQF